MCLRYLKPMETLWKLSCAILGKVDQCCGREDQGWSWDFIAGRGRSGGGVYEDVCHQSNCSVVWQTSCYVNPFLCFYPLLLSDASCWRALRGQDRVAGSKLNAASARVVNTPKALPVLRDFRVFPGADASASPSRQGGFRYADDFCCLPWKDFVVNFQCHC